MPCTGLVTPLPMAKYKNIPIFIPHRGCPNQCVFCNQKTISASSGYSLSDIKMKIEETLSHTNENDKIEIAFFGGSFTGIDREEMTTLLSLANRYLKLGKICGIRLSTRPDYISKEILDILALHGVTDIEIGVQSLDDGVLGCCQRGHSAETTRNALRLIAQYGCFSTVGQMMLGLPDSTKEKEIATAKELFLLGIRQIRIYPTVVLRDTPLEKMTESGTYRPLTLDEAVQRAADILMLADEYGVKCLRIGLCENEDLHSENGMLIGPFHPAFGELAISEIFFRNCQKVLGNTPLSGKEVTLFIPKSSLSKAIGQKRNNIHRLQELYHTKKIRFIESDTLSGYQVRAQEDHCIASQIT